MKIIRLSTFLDFGGVETRLANISHVKDNHEWIFVCMNKEGRAAEIIKGNNKRVINLNCKPSIYSLKTLRVLYKTLKKEKPDVIHTSGAEANFHGIIAGKLAGVPKIIGEEIGTPSHSKKAKIIFSLIYKMANFVIGNSDAVLKVVHEIDSVPYSKLKRIANPIIFRKLPEVIVSRTAKNDFRIIMISRLEAVKNIEGVLNVLSRLVTEKTNVKLTIAGSGRLENDLKQKTRVLGLKNHVDFVGFITNPYPYLINSDLYILNSHTEGFSNSLIEAMYSKTPSLSTNVGAAPEIIKDNENGFLVAANNEELLYEKIKLIISMTPETRTELGIKGHEKTKDFSLDKHIEKLMENYSNTNA